MSVEKHDLVTGRATTGHEWNGIEELETPIPRVVFVFLGLATLIAVLCWILWPTWPLGSTYTKGILGADQRKEVMQQVADADAKRASAWAGQVAALPLGDIRASAALMEPVKDAGRTLFIDNCAVCHGVGGTGGPGYPDLTAKAWLWGGELETIAETIRIGINSTNDDTRMSQMMAFGRDKVLEPAQISNVVAYVRSLSGLTPDEGDAGRMAAGKTIFAENCAACHGANGKGNREVGAPDLTDHNWLYGSDTATVYETVYSGRQGHMPNWGARLSPLQVKILALYVASLEKHPK